MKSVLSGRLNGIQRNYLKSLLDMMYRPRELAEELGVSQNQIYRVYIPLGCPHERDEHNHIWIHGESFTQWYLETYKKTEIKENEAFCRTCKQAVQVTEPKYYQKKDTQYLICLCPVCGRKISKITGSSHD